VATAVRAPGYLDGLDAETFDLTVYLAQFDAKLLAKPEGRRVLTRLNPLLFALVYVRHHLRDGKGKMTFGDAHLDWCRAARAWIRPALRPAEHRDAYIAPRNMGKSTWWFLALPLWAAAHGHVRFAAAFASSATQAETHLASFKRELDVNPLLRQDFPDLCSPAKRPSGGNVADTQSMFIARNGFVFAARGIDSSNLGMKVEERRPDLILCDDIEPDESSYSPDQARKRRTTLIDSILPLNVYARVVISGTVTMPGSIIHELVKHGRGIESAEWVREEGFSAHYTPPIVQRDDGTERSVWPGKWPLAYLKSIEHTRSFAKNYANDPMGADGALWSPDDFRYPGEEGIDPVTHMMLSIDPAVTAKKGSDYTGLAVVSWSARHKRCTVHAVAGLKIQPGPLLRERVLALLDEYPQIGLILIEVNQGGDTWEAILHGMPVKVKTVNQSENKFTRAEGVLNHYQRGRVIHARRLVEVEQQMCAFPKAPHDDLVDAVGSAVRRFIPTKREVPKVGSSSYL
jgi:predicted phage terminase large subunit-like protein